MVDFDSVNVHFPQIQVYHRKIEVARGLTSLVLIIPAQGMPVHSFPAHNLFSEWKHNFTNHNPLTAVQKKLIC